MTTRYTDNHLGAALCRTGLATPRAPFLRGGQGQIIHSYASFFANAERMAAVLVARGLQPGDRIAVQAPKTVAMLELYLGCVLAGGVFLPLNTAYTSEEVGYFLADAAPHILVCDPDRAAQALALAEAHQVAHVLTIGTDERGSLPELRDGQAPGFKPVARSASDLAAILYTSGTTGRSKGAMLSHGALRSNAEILADYWDFGPQDRLIHALPIFHTHGLFVATNVTLMAGGSAVFMAGFDAPAIVQAMRQGATALMGVPTFYTRLLAAPGLARAARNMRLFISGSAPLLAETHRAWHETTGHQILERYGMTETNMNTSNPLHGVRKPGTVGLPLPGIEVTITDPDPGRALPQGEIGVIEVRGANVFSGYWNMPEKTAEELRENGFFITGDLGQMDEEGYVSIVGRSKDLIITGGFNVYPKELELVIDTAPGVLESAVIGVAHPDFGEAVVAVVVPDPTSAIRPTPEIILAQAAAQLARFKLPKSVQILPELPRNAMGKVQKNLLRDQFAALFG